MSKSNITDNCGEQIFIYNYQYRKKEEEKHCTISHCVFILLTYFVPKALLYTHLFK